MLNPNAFMRETAEITFQDFVAKQSIGPDGTTVIDWRNRNGSGVNSCLFTLTGNYLFLAGDLGEAVFVLTEPAKLERIVKYGVQYLVEKMSAGESGYTYDQETAFKELDDEVEYMKASIRRQENAEDNLERLEEAVETLKNEFSPREGFVHFGVDAAVETLCNLGSDVLDWLCYCGRTIARRPYMWMTALRMANDQLSGKRTFLERLSQVGSLAGQRAEAAKQIEVLLRAMEEDDEVLSPDCICLDGIRLMGGIVSAGQLYTVEAGAAGTLLARGKRHLLRRYEYCEDGSDPILTDSLDYYVDQRVGYCEDDFYGTMYFILSENEDGLCKLLACPYEC